jgi:hypothetical protein
MRVTTSAVLLLAGLMLGGCGDRHVDDGGRGTIASSPSCPHATTGGQPLAPGLDLDGDGTADDLSVRPRTPSCEASLTATVSGREADATLDEDLPVDLSRSFAIAVPGRAGDIAVVLQTHPRGGLQARLFGYSDGKLQELTVAGRPILPFIATDVQTTPLSARCTADGFEILAARAHEPAGIVPAWDIDRTAYTIDGNAVARGDTTEIADNVLDEQLQATYADLVGHSLFENCLAGD